MRRAANRLSVLSRQCARLYSLGNRPIANLKEDFDQLGVRKLPRWQPIVCNGDNEPMCCRSSCLFWCSD